MKTFCEKFNHWLFHPVDTSLVCDHRALKFPECRACRGIEVPKIKATAPPASKELIPKLIALNVGKDEWMEAVREVQEEYNIYEDSKQDGTAARRIGELVPAEKGGRGQKTCRTSASFPEHQRLSEFRKLAEIPEEEFKKRIEVTRGKEEKISYNTLLRGDFYQMSETPEWETPQWLFDILDKEFHFEVDVCASEKNHKWKKFYSKNEDGLKQDCQRGVVGNRK